MDITQAQALCQLLKLGNLIRLPRKVASNTTHAIWSFQTAQNHYAIKEITHRQNFEHFQEKYETSEKIARTFAKNNIPALTSYLYDNQAIISLNEGHFMIYPWFEGQALAQKQISLSYTKQIAELIARLHQLNIELPALSEAPWYLHSQDDFISLSRTALLNRLPFATMFQQQLEAILSLNQNYLQSIDVLKRNLRISHGDIHRRNLLWQTPSQYSLIDWESAGYINPLQEIMGGAFHWSGIGSLNINFDIFYSMLQAYQDVMGTFDEDPKIGFYGEIGTWLDWLFYHLHHNTPISIRKVKKAIVTLSYYAELEKSLF